MFLVSNGGWSPLSLESLFLDCQDHVITWMTSSVILWEHCYPPYCLKWQSSPGWSEAVCCAMAEFQIQLFEASTRCKTSFRTKMLDPLSVAFIAFFPRAQEESWYVYTLAKTLFRILIPHGESS